jgi:GNAT superfamily N-acetyltransferase
MGEVGFTTDPAEAWRCTRALLASDPVRNNVVCTLLEQRAASGTAVRCWFADGGVVFQSPDTFPAVLSTLSPDAVPALAEAVAAVGVPGVTGTAADAAAFAGAYATVTRRAARPVEGQRIYEVTDLIPPPAADGQMRPATAADVGLLAGWIDGFARDTGEVVDTDARTRAAVIVDAGRYWIWETSAGEPVSSALLAPSAMGVARIGGVYTPPAWRRRGFAAAVVAGLSSQVLAGGERAILYTQLQNPTSNGVYQRIGFEPVAEVVRYSFG